jgi:hypothetical protein
MMLSGWRRLPALFSLSMVLLAPCLAAGAVPSPPATLQAAQGGLIVYGVVPGASTQPAAMARLLRNIQKQSGEAPQVGQVFRFRGTRSVGVFFSVTSHPEGGKRVAGLVIACATGPGQVEAALLTDTAARFGQTVNPMLKQLFGVWHPDAGVEPPGGAPAPAAGPAPHPAPGLRPAAGPAPELHPYTLPDRTASVGLPAGWQVSPRSGGGGIVLNGTQGEVVVLNSMFLAQDPQGSAYRNSQRLGARPGRGMVVFPANADLVRNFAAIVQQLSRSMGFVPAGLKIDYAEAVEPPPGASFEGERAALATGSLDPNGKGTQHMFRVLCATPPDPYGDFSYRDYVAYFPHTEAGQANALAAAIFSSFRVDQQLVAQRASAEAAPHIAHLKQVDAAQRAAVQARTAQIVGNINQIGANATARMQSVGAANEAQHAQWNAGQAANARNGQGFSNYLLDQTVVQDNNLNGNGTVGHGTVWNRTAEALVKADPKRFELVDTPDYWEGTDFHR